MPVLDVYDMTWQALGKAAALQAPLRLQWDNPLAGEPSSIVEQRGIEVQVAYAHVLTMWQEDMKNLRPDQRNLLGEAARRNGGQGGVDAVASVLSRVPDAWKGDGHSLIWASMVAQLHTFLQSPFLGLSPMLTTEAGRLALLDFGTVLLETFINLSALAAYNDRRGEGAYDTQDYLETAAAFRRGYINEAIYAAAARLDGRKPEPNDRSAGDQHLEYLVHQYVTARRTELQLSEEHRQFKRPAAVIRAELVDAAAAGFRNGVSWWATAEGRGPFGSAWINVPELRLKRWSPRMPRLLNGPWLLEMTEAVCEGAVKYLRDHGFPKSHTESLID